MIRFICKILLCIVTPLTLAGPVHRGGSADGEAGFLIIENETRHFVTLLLGSRTCVKKFTGDGCYSTILPPNLYLVYGFSKDRVSETKITFIFKNYPDDYGWHVEEWYVDAYAMPSSKTKCEFDDFSGLHCLGVKAHE